MHPNAQADRAKTARASAIAAEAPSLNGGTPAQYLRLLGERVRDARARHGMTRKMLAHDCGVSERYLAQLESARGNLSIVLLRRVAAAIDVPLAELVSEELPPVEQQWGNPVALVTIEPPRELDERAQLAFRRDGTDF